MASYSGGVVVLVTAERVRVRGHWSTKAMTKQNILTYVQIVNPVSTELFDCV